MATPTQVMEILNRLTALDGITSPVPSGAQVPVIQKDLNGLHTTINQLTLTLQAQLNTIAQQLQTLQGTVNKILGGVPGIVPISAPAVVNEALTAYDATTGLFTQASVSPAGGVSSVFGRTAAVVAHSGDYNYSEIGGSTSGINITDNSSTGISITENNTSSGGVTISAAVGGTNGIAVRALAGTIYLDSATMAIGTVQAGEAINIGSANAGSINIYGSNGFLIEQSSVGSVDIETATGEIIMWGDNTSDPQLLIQSENGGLGIDHLGTVTVFAGNSGKLVVAGISVSTEAGAPSAAATIPSLYIDNSTGNVYTYTSGGWKELTLTP